uniref:Uncharacterized protein LOC102808608 n=1 Tax=Saccoglossus kowalevskii TaxID=10224 RepID=A0ABM0MDW9_SACKO|nr:PREDICTED: uncharacterized protein LOC102808608 [Saccoglossus kowalevskii]
MKNIYPEIKHSLDIWHTAKNLTKKIVKAGQVKDCKMLLEWAKHIANHFWYCCQQASTEMEFLGMWGGLLHHVVNEHEWSLTVDQAGTGQCLHGPLTEEASGDGEWLQRGSKALDALRNIVFDKRFLKKYLTT